MKPGRYALEQARKQRSAFLREHAGFLALVALGYIVIIGPLALFWPWPSDGSKWFGMGFAAAGLPWFLSMLIVTSDGSVNRRWGAHAEVWTARALRPLEGKGWTILNGVPFDGFDVDHVAIGPTGVFALETKWTGSAHAGPFARARLESNRKRARDGARKIKLLLSTTRIRLGVAPVLVLQGSPEHWGHVGRTDDVEVVLGQDLKDWVARMADTQPILSDEEVREIASAITTQAERVEAHRAR